MTPTSSFGVFAMALFALFLSPPTSANPGGGGGSGGGTGSLPSSAPTNWTRSTDPCNDGKEKAGPGGSVSNVDGVTASIGSGGKGSVSLDPRGGTAACESTLSTKTGTTTLDADGLDSNDRANIGASNSGTISGDGGLVTLAGGSTVTVTNTAPAGSTNTITVVLPSGAKTTVLANSSATFHT